MKNRNENLVGGVILITLGLLFLIGQFFPGLFGGWFDWPWIVIGVGGVFLVAAFASRTGAFAIPGAIVGGIGLILLWQNATGNWDSWSYIWTLIPGFAGVGVLLASFIETGSTEPRAGLILMGISLIGFVIFGSAFGLGWAVWQFWPLILIGIGVWILFRDVLRPGRHREETITDPMPPRENE